MHFKFSIFSLVCLLLISFQNVSAKGSAESPALRAVSENTTEAVPAIEELRSMGPSGLATLMKQYDQEITRHVDSPTVAVSPEWLRISAALDAVSQQRNSYLSGLYW